MTDALVRLAIPALVFAIYFIYPIPHTIALRNVLLAVLLAAAGGHLFALRGEPRRPDWSRFHASAWLLAALTVWLTVQSAFISPVAPEALGMLRGDWLVALIAAGIAATAVAAGDGAGRVLHAVAFSLAAHIVGLLAYQSAVWLTTGQTPFGMTPFAAKDYHSMLVTTLAALAVADLLARAAIGRAVFRVSWYWSAATLLLCGIASLTLLARNATIIVALLLIVGGAMQLTLRHASHQHRLALVVAVALLLGAGGWLGVHSDTRWSGFREAARIAFDTEGNLAWLDAGKHPLPLTKNGAPVEESAYLRLAWAKVGIEQIGRYPLGLGYGHKAFGWAVNRSYRVDTGHQSSHSGLIDFTLANGIPGLALWLALSGALIAAGWRGFRRDASPTGLALALTVIAYLVRCLLDGHLSGFRLEMYAFLVGALVVMQAREGKPCA